MLARLRRDWPASRKSATWQQYERLVRVWERWHDGPGPCVSTITSEMLSGFFHSVPEWNSLQTWKRNADQLTALLKSACRQSGANKEGLPRGTDAPLRLDELPFVALPAPDWFRRERVAGSHRRGGHTPKRRSTLTLPEFQRVVDACWSTPGIGEPIWWETLFGWLWFSGMRITQTRELLAWCDDGLGEGLDLASRSLVTVESKCGGLISVPIPSVLVPGLTWLRYHSDRIVFRRAGLVSDPTFRRHWRRIWDHAIPVATDTDRELRHFAPHELRAVSVTNWDMLPAPDNGAGHLVTGHSAKSVRTACYFQPGDARLREIIERYPMPALRAAAHTLPL